MPGPNPYFRISRYLGRRGGRRTCKKEVQNLWAAWVFVVVLLLILIAGKMRFY